MAAAAALAFLAGSASAEPWQRRGDRLDFQFGGLSFPANAGGLTLTETGEASHKGETLDNVAQYRSADETVFATVYVYYPGLPDARLAALATDWAIRENSPKVVGGEFRAVPAGGRDAAALRADYDGYRGGLASVALFLKLGRWIVAIRVSGPEARKADVETAAAALLGGIRATGDHSFRPSRPLTVAPCREGATQPPATALPDVEGPRIISIGLLGTFDGGGLDGKDQAGRAVTLPPRVPDTLCRTTLTTKDGKHLLLKAEDGPVPAVDGRTVRLVLLSDSGRALEVDHAANLGGYVLLYHDLGVTDVLGLYDAIPSDAQLAAILDGTDQQGSRIRVPVGLIPGKGTTVSLPSFGNAAKAPAAAPPR
jgi:hypothetical protein